MTPAKIKWTVCTPLLIPLNKIGKRNQNSIYFRRLRSLNLSSPSLSESSSDGAANTSLDLFGAVLCAGCSDAGLFVPWVWPSACKLLLELDATDVSGSVLEPERLFLLGKTNVYASGELLSSERVLPVPSSGMLALFRDSEFPNCRSDSQ